MACWNRVTAKIVDGLPSEQVEDLCYARKVPLIYGRAALNNWQAFADAKIASVTPARERACSGTASSVSAGGRVGPRYAGQVLRPDAEPAADGSRAADVPGRPQRPDAVPQLFAYSTGQQLLRELSWPDLEDSVIDVIDRTVNK